MTISSLSFCSVVKNEELLISDLIESIKLFSKSLEDYELIFVDDFSSDKTYNVIKEFSEHDSNIKVVKNSSPGKVSGTNLALKLCTKDYVKFIDGDDLIKGNLSNLPSQFDCLYHDYNELNGCDEKYISIGNWMCSSPKIVQNEFRSIPKAMFIFKTTFIENYFPIPEILPFEDLWINFIASEAKSLVYIEESLYIYRQHSNQFYGSHSNFNNNKRVRMGKRFRDYYSYLKDYEHPFSFTPKIQIKYYSDILLRKNFFYIIYLLRSPKLLLKSILYNFPFLIKYIWNK